MLLNLGLFINHLICSLPLESILDIALCSLIYLNIRCLCSGKATNVTKNCSQERSWKLKRCDPSHKSTAYQSKSIKQATTVAQKIEGTVCLSFNYIHIRWTIQNNSSVLVANIFVFLCWPIAHYTRCRTFKVVSLKLVFFSETNLHKSSVVWNFICLNIDIDPVRLSLIYRYSFNGRFFLYTLLTILLLFEPASVVHDSELKILHIAHRLIMAPLTVLGRGRKVFACPKRLTHLARDSHDIDWSICSCARTAVNRKLLFVPVDAIHIIAFAVLVEPASRTAARLVEFCIVLFFALVNIYGMPVD